MMKREWIGGIGFILLAAVLFFPVMATGSPVTIQWKVSGSPEIGDTINTGWDWQNDVYANPDTEYYWNMRDYRGAIEIDFAGDKVYIDELSIAVKADPYIDLTFAARYTGTNAKHFSFTSDLLLIDPALVNAEGYAEATTSHLSGVTITGGDFTDNNIYRAEYNGGTIFADLSPGGIYGSAGSTSISGQVSSMQAKWGFNLKGGSATGVSHFEIMGETIPEPATIALLGLGGLALIRKRRA